MYVIYKLKSLVSRDPYITTKICLCSPH